MENSNLSLDELAERVQRVVGDRYQIEMGSGDLRPAQSEWRWFLATERRSGRQVVIKTLRIEDELVGVRFEKELGAVDSMPGWMGVPDLGHPRIMSILSRGHGEGVLYYVTPWLAEGSLRNRLEREGTLAVADAVRILGEVAEGLGRLHEHGVVHQHIKPENILFDQGHAVVAEFVGFFNGVPTEVHYGSPESLAGLRPDRRSVVYSLATVGFEMLAGRRPFVGETLKVIYGIVGGSPPLLTSVRPEAPRAVAEVLAKALARLPEDRFPDVVSFGAALDAAARAPSGGVGGGS